MSQRFQHRPWPRLWRTALVTLLSLLVLVMISSPLLNFSSAHAQGTTSLGVDIVADGNTATSLGNIQDCREVQVGDLFSADIYIRDVQGLKAWEFTLGFDPAILEVTHHNNRLFLASAAFDASEPIPDTDGQHFMAVATLGSGSSGTGVLTRVTFRAKAPGRSPATIVFLDVNGDGKVDYGPRLNPGTRPLGDSDGDGIFDGPVSHAEVAVGQSCSGSEPKPPPTPPPASTPTPAPTPGATPEDTSLPSGAVGDSGIDAPPVSVLLTDSPPRSASGELLALSLGDSGTDTPPASVLLTDSPPWSAFGEWLALSLQGGEAADDAVGGEDPLAENPDADTLEASLQQVGQPPSGLTDGVPPAGASAPQPAGGDSSTFPLWMVGAIAGLLIATGAGFALIARSLRQPW